MVINILGLLTKTNDGKHLLLLVSNTYSTPTLAIQIAKMSSTKIATIFFGHWSCCTEYILFADGYRVAVGKNVLLHVMFFLQTEKM